MASALLPPSSVLHTDTLPGITAVKHASLVVNTGGYSILCRSTHPGEPDVRLGLIYFAHFLWARRMSDVLPDFVLIFGRAAASLAHLRIEGDCSTADAATWATVFRTFPALTCLQASAAESVFSGVLAASETVGASSMTDGRARARLEEVWVEEGRQETVEGMAAVLDAALVWLRCRAERGARLKKLRVLVRNPQAGAGLKDDAAGDRLEVLKDRYLSELGELVEDVTFGRVKS